MRGVIRFTTPLEADLTLAVTATLKEWREIEALLQEGEPTGAPDVFRRQVSDLIRRAETSLAQGSWTTGYSAGNEPD